MLWLHQTRWLVNGETTSKVYLGPTFSGCLNVWTAGVGGVWWWWWRCVAGWWGGKGAGRSGLCGHGWCVWEEGGRGREGSVIQDLFCLSHILRIWLVAVCLDVFRHVHRTRKVFWIFAPCTDTETILRSAIARAKGDCHLGTYHPDAWLVIFELTLLISAWRWSKARGATWIWWAWKHVSWKKRCPYEEMKMSAWWQRCRGLVSPWLPSSRNQPLRKARSEKRGFFVFRFSFFSIICSSFFYQNAKTTFLSLLIKKKGGPKMTCFVIFGPFYQKAPFLTKGSFLSNFLFFYQNFPLFSSWWVWTTSLYPAQVQAHFISSGTRSTQVYTDKFVSQLFSPNREGTHALCLALRGQIRALCTESWLNEWSLVIVIEKGKRGFLMFVCVFVWGVEGEMERRGGGVLVRCDVLCVWTLCLFVETVFCVDACVCDVCVWCGVFDVWDVMWV